MITHFGHGGPTGGATSSYQQYYRSAPTYNIPNTSDNFANNFDTYAGSFGRLTSDPVLATGGCMIISDDFRQCNFSNYNPFVLRLDWPSVADWAYASIFAMAVRFQNQDHQFWISHKIIRTRSLI